MVQNGGLVQSRSFSGDSMHGQRALMTGEITDEPWKKVFRGSHICWHPVAPGMPVVAAQSPALNPLQSRKLQPIAAHCSSWESLPCRLAIQDANDRQFLRGPTERLSPQPAYWSHLCVVDGDPRFAARNAHESGCQIGFLHVA